MNKSLLQTTLRRWIWLSSKSDQPFGKHVSLERFKTSYNYIDSHIVLKSPKEMRLGQVLWNQVPSSFAHLLFLAYHANSTSTTGSGGFHYVHILVVAHFSFVAPTFVVLWEKIGCRTYLEIFTVSSPLSLNISPKVAFVADVPGPSKMINLLKLIHIPELTRTNKAGPEAVPRSTIGQSETSELEGINHAIIGMSRIINSKGESWIRFQIILSKLLNSVLSKRSLNFEERWIVEEDAWLSAWNWSIRTSYDIVWRSP